MIIISYGIPEQALPCRFSATQLLHQQPTLHSCKHTHSPSTQNAVPGEYMPAYTHKQNLLVTYIYANIE